MSPKKREASKPEWLGEYRKRTRIIEVIDAAFDPEIPDGEVRDMLKEAAVDLGDLFMPPDEPQPRRRRR